MYKNIAHFLKDESGQGTAEYLLILAAAVAMVLAFKKPIIQAIKDATDTVGKGLGTAAENLLKPE